MAVPNKSFVVSKIDANHTASLNKLTSTPVSSASHAASAGITQTEAQHRLSLLVDCGLAVQQKGSKGQTLDSYVLA